MTRTTMHTPWGWSQDVEELAEGVLRVSTAGHGGLKLSRERWDSPPPRRPGRDGPPHLRRRGLRGAHRQDAAGHRRQQGQGDCARYRGTLRAVTLPRSPISATMRRGCTSPVGWKGEADEAQRGWATCPSTAPLRKGGLRPCTTKERYGRCVPSRDGSPS